MVDIQSAAAEIRQGIKKGRQIEERNHGKNIMSAPATQGDHNNVKQHGAPWQIHLKIRLLASTRHPCRHHQCNLPMWENMTSSITLEVHNVKGGPSHAPGNRYRKFCEALDMWFLRYVSGQTEKRQTFRQTHSLQYFAPLSGVN